MSKRQSLMLMGAIVIAFLFLGLPEPWDKYVAILLGLSIIFVSYKLIPEPVRAKSVNFVEHKNEDKVQSDANSSSDSITKTETNIIS